MIRHIRNVLRPEELSRLQSLAKVVRFVDGRMTNPETSVKNNLQVPQNDPLATEPGVLVRDALMRHAELRAFALPKQMARPTMARYEPGMNYGWHVDEALFPSNPPMRSDLSCTIWLSSPISSNRSEAANAKARKRSRCSRNCSASVSTMSISRESFACTFGALP